MTSILLPLAALTSLAMASSPSTAFNLILNVTVPGTDFVNASINGAYLGTEHIGAGQDALIPSTVSGVDLAYTINDTIQDALNPNFWEGFSMSSSSSSGNQTNNPLGVQLIVGSDAPFGVPTTGGDEDEEAACFAVSTPLNGTFAICDLGIDAPEAPRYPLYFVPGSSADWYAAENVPDNCVAVKLLLQCSDDDEFDDSDEVQKVLCYEDVASIDWSQQAECS